MTAPEVKTRELRISRLENLLTRAKTDEERVRIELEINVIETELKQIREVTHGEQ